MLVEIGEVLLQEVELVLGDRLQDVLVVMGEEEKLATATALALY